MTTAAAVAAAATLVAPATGQSAEVEAEQTYVPPPPPTIGDVLDASFEVFRRVAAEQVARIEAVAARTEAMRPNQGASVSITTGPGALP